MQPGSIRFKLYAKIYKKIWSLMEGGEDMSEIRKPLAELLVGVKEGTIPLDTGEVGSKIADKHIKDRNADDREARRVGEQKMAENMREAQKAILGVK